MRKTINTLIGLVSVSIVCCGGLVPRANAEEQLSFVQTAISGTGLSGGDIPLYPWDYPSDSTNDSAGVSIETTGIIQQDVNFSDQSFVLSDSGSIASNPNSASPILSGDINFISGVSYQGTLMDLNDSASSHYVQVGITPDVQIVPEPAPFVLAGFTCTVIAAARLRKRGFRLC